MKSEPEYSEEYYEHIARTMGQEQADWARLPRDEREREIAWYHEHFNTPDDLAEWPPELDGGLHNGFDGKNLVRKRPNKTLSETSSDNVSSTEPIKNPPGHQ
jgi:hypothetical protein